MRRISTWNFKAFSDIPKGTSEYGQSDDWRNAEVLIPLRHFRCESNGLRADLKGYDPQNTHPYSEIEFVGLRRR